MINFEYLFFDVVWDIFINKVYVVVVYIVVMVMVYCSVVNYILVCYKIRRKKKGKNFVKIYDISLW